jgi:group II intron reverse transcriptase/maturase
MIDMDTPQTQSWGVPPGVPGLISSMSGIDRIRLAARKDKNARFTALMHHIDQELVEDSFEALDPKASPGADGLMVEKYREELGRNIKELWERVQEGSYEPMPSLRRYIPKSDGRMRPLGIASLEDKIVQRAVSQVLSAIYEEDFKDFSFGFRPGRDCHCALDSLYMAITSRKVNWVLDADIKGYFDSISHEWMVRFLEHRIADKRMLRLVKLWLEAGILEEGVFKETTRGTPQGAGCSPLLANVFLHYALDLWADRWGNKEARGEVILIRYADDFVVCFQHKDDATRFLDALVERLAKFELTLHPEKTRLIEFGRFAAERRRRRGERRPETFDFLGFTHICSMTRQGGKFKLLRVTATGRWRAKMKGLKDEMRRRIDQSIETVGKWLKKVLTGYYNYYAAPDNGTTLWRFRFLVAKTWMKTVRRRSNRKRMTWVKFASIINKWLPKPHAVHPYPSQR